MDSPQGDGTPHSGTTVSEQDYPNTFYFSESGFYNPALGLGTNPAPGLPDFGTRLKVTFNNIPAGVTISGPAGFISTDTTNFGLLTVHQTATETGPYNPSVANAFTATASANSHTFVYEVTDADISSTRVTISFKASWSGAPNQPALGTVQMAAWYAPTSTNLSAGTAAVAPIPRFQDFSQPAVSAFTIVSQCSTIPTVTSFNVLFGSQSYNLANSTRHSLPWNIVGIRVVFSKPIASGSAASLVGTAATGLSGLGTNTLTWSITPVGNANLALSLAANGPSALKDASGNRLAGGAGFSQFLRVFWGDFNDDGFVTATDMVGVNNARSLPYNIFADMNGNGNVGVDDVQVVRTRVGTFPPF
ncbi:MAG: hypothetical protein HYX25_01785 [Candidatus Solibacter usitatus]|nr:hypothetical protein [Candidatus Solibacter usitatus]